MYLSSRDEAIANDTFKGRVLLGAVTGRTLLELRLAAELLVPSMGFTIGEG
jgi:hypothetical protein